MDRDKIIEFSNLELLGDGIKYDLIHRLFNTIESEFDGEIFDEKAASKVMLYLRDLKDIVD